jgi:hypothetical protein
MRLSAVWNGGSGLRGVSFGVMGKTVTCPDCAGVVSRSATKCPHCGRPLKADSSRTILLLAVFAILIYLVDVVLKAKGI